MITMKQTLGQNQEGIVWVKVLMMESIFDEIIGLIKNDRSVQIGEQSKSFRSRLVTYPAPKSPQKLPKTYSIETYVEHKARLILIEKWQLTIEDTESDDGISCQSNPGLSLTLFLQALKSTLHFSAVTSLKSQKLGISIKTREWSGSSDMYQNEFQFDSEEKKLPTVHLSCGKRLHINLCTIRRRVIHSLLAQLTSPPTHKKKLTNDELASISLDSGFLSDSKDDLDSNDAIFSPPSKQLKFNDKPSVRTLLTSPVGNSKLCSDMLTLKHALANRTTVKVHSRYYLSSITIHISNNSTQLLTPFIG